MCKLKSLYQRLSKSTGNAKGNKENSIILEETQYNALCVLEQILKQTKPTLQLKQVHLSCKIYHLDEILKVDITKQLYPYLNFFTQINNQKKDFQFPTELETKFTAGRIWCHHFPTELDTKFILFGRFMAVKPLTVILSTNITKLGLLESLH